MKSGKTVTVRAFSLLAVGSFLIAGAHLQQRAFAYEGQDSAAANNDDDANYDRLDGTGASAKKVDVVEWEGNLEIHVMPAGSLKGLALKIDRANKNKPVMVIGYRFDNDPKKQLIRRAILGISLADNFKVYRDASADGYDKIVITNNDLGKTLAVYKTDPAPTQLYPDGHPALVAQSAVGDENRNPAANAAPAKTSDSDPSDSGSISPFFMKEPGSAGNHR